LIRTYTYKLYRNDKTEAKFNKWLGVTRYVYNAAKETKEVAYKEGLKLSGYDLSKQLTECKKEFSWLREVGNTTLQSTILKLDRSYQNFFSGRAKFPKWASKKNWNSFEFAQGNLKNSRPSLRFEKDGVFNLPKFGKVKVFNYRPIDERSIKTARLIKKADGIYLSVVAEVKDKTLTTNENQVGIDMGIKYFMVTSDGEFTENPKFLDKQLKKLRVEQRKLSRKFKQGAKVQSNNYYKQANIVARLHKKVVDCRKDFLHKTSTYLAKEYSTVFHEDLKITNMVKSNLSRHISDVSWGTFFVMLKYKTKVVRVNPAYTSQKCSSCGHKAKENRVTQSIFKCVACGHEENADLNAAYNILKLGTSSVDANVGH